MNKTEVAFGCLTILFSLSAIVLIITGVGMSTTMPGRYAWKDARRAYYFMAVLPVLGIAIIVHGARRSKTSEWLLGLLVLIWSLFSLWWVPLSIFDGSDFFKGTLMGEFFKTSWPLIAFVFLGIAPVVNGICEKRNTFTGIGSIVKTDSKSKTYLLRVPRRFRINHRGSFLCAVIATTVFMIPAIPPVKADSIIFNDSDIHHVPNVRWILDPAYVETDPFAGGYLSTTPHEEATYGSQWQVERTSVTVRFPDTPDPSVIGAGNWLAVGMFVQGKDDTIDYQDYGFYTTLVLDSEGGLWLDVGGRRTNELSGWRTLMFNKTWQIQGLSRSTPVTLIAAWNAEGFIIWNVTINGVTYQPPNNTFDMRNIWPTVIEKFYVGWDIIWPANPPFNVCYFFQFGVTSPNHIWQSGWNALIESPKWYKNGEWHIVQQAQTVQGPFAFLDSAFMWGGASFNAEVKCHNNDPSMEPYKAKFYYSLPLAHNYYLWNHQDDAGTGGDAGNDLYSSTLVTPGTYVGEFYDPSDTEDWYKIAAEYGKDIIVHAWATQTTPTEPKPKFTVFFYDHEGYLWGSSGPGYDQWIGYTADADAHWYIELRCNESYGSYSFSIGLYGQHGGISGCPYVSTWNGSAYMLDNNLMPMSEFSSGVDVTDYYMLQKMLTPKEDGTYSLLLSEFENEHSYFDQIKLLAIDHTSDTNVAVSPYGEILTYTNPYPAVSAINNDNQQVKTLLNSIDGNYYEGYYGSYVELNFGDLNVSQGAKLVVRSDPPPPQTEKSPIFVQIMDSEGRWQTVAAIHTRTYWSTDIIDLAEYLPDAHGNLKVRLYFVSNDRIDFVGLDTSQQATTQVEEGQLVSAVHLESGNVTSMLSRSDDSYTNLVPGQQIEVAFRLPEQTMQKRDYVLVTEGRYYSVTP